MTSIYNQGVVSVGLATSKSDYGLTTQYSIQRLPTDPYYIADVSVKNMVVGSTWVLGYGGEDGELTTLDSGTCTVSDFVISNVPAYGSPFLLELWVRKGSAAPKYIPVRSYGFHASSGVTIYVSQVEDEVA